MVILSLNLVEKSRKGSTERFGPFELSLSKFLISFLL